MIEAVLKLRLSDSRTCELIHNVRLLKSIESLPSWWLRW